MKTILRLSIAALVLAAFNFSIVMVEACTDLANPDWSSVGTNTLTDGYSTWVRASPSRHNLAG